MQYTKRSAGRPYVAPEPEEDRTTVTAFDFRYVLQQSVDHQ